MSTLTVTWPDLPHISLKTITGSGELSQCAIHWEDRVCINLVLLPNQKVAVVRAAPSLPETVILALGRTIAMHQGAFVPAGDFVPGDGNEVKSHPPVEIPWGNQTRQLTCSTIYQETEVARLFILSDPQIPSAGMQFKSAPTEDMWRTIARLVLEHRASLPGADEGEL